MELLASINRPMRNGRSVCALKSRISFGGLLLSKTLNSFCVRSLMNLPCLSVTVKMRLTSGTVTLMVPADVRSSPLLCWAPLADGSSVLLSGEAPGGFCGVDGAGVCVCAQPRPHKSRKTMKDLAGILIMLIIVWKLFSLTADLAQKCGQFSR